MDASSFIRTTTIYDYSNSIEDLRAVMTDDGAIKFELHESTFTDFIECARKNFRSFAGETVPAESWLILSSEEQEKRRSAASRSRSPRFRTMVAGKRWGGSIWTLLGVSG